MQEEKIVGVVAVDPGVTCGVALLTSGGDVVETFTCDFPFKRLERTLGEHEDAEVVCESPPKWARHYVQSTQGVEQIVRDAPQEVTWILPGMWKGSPPTRGTAPGDTVHERDAVRMGRYYLWLWPSNPRRRTT